MGRPGTPEGPVVLSEFARVTLPTSLGVFDARAFECGSGLVYLALIKGDVAGREDVLVRVHSECLTGDALGSLRCDCGIQLRLALRAIAAAGEGVLVYATGSRIGGPTPSTPTWPSVCRSTPDTMAGVPPFSTPSASGPCAC